MGEQMKTIFTLYVSLLNSERLQQCDLGQFKTKKSFSNFQLTHSTKQQLGERTLSLVSVLKKKKIRDDNGFENLLNWNRLVRKKNLICRIKKKQIFSFANCYHN